MNSLYIKKKIFLSNALLQLASISLMACGNNFYTYHTYRGNAVPVKYENESISGTISKENVEKYIKEVTLEQNGNVKKYLMIKDFECSSTPHNYYTYLRYFELESGTVMLESFWRTNLTEEEVQSKEPTEFLIGENVMILEEQSFFNYLFETDRIQREYDINDLLKWFREKNPLEENIIEEELSR